MAQHASNHAGHSGDRLEEHNAAEPLRCSIDAISAKYR
jgi:hypothetical protein